MADTEFVTHPLFPLSDDEDDPEAAPPDVQEIHIQRKENGRMVTAPRVFLPGEMMSLAQLFGEYGGGEYHLVARNHKKQLQGRRMYSLPGPSKPMFDDGVPLGGQKQATPTSLNPMAAMMQGDGGTMGLIMMMMQQMMQAQTTAAANQSQMMMAFIQSMASGNQAQIAAAQENMNRQAERDARDKESQMAMLIKLTEARGTGNSTGGEDSFFKGVEFMRHFATQQVEMMKTHAKGDSDFDLEGLLGTVMQALQGFNALNDMKGMGAPEVVVPVS